MGELADYYVTNASRDFDDCPNAVDYFLAEHKRISYSDANPTGTREVSWLHIRGVYANKVDPRFVGKWLIFVPKTKINKIWKRIRNATQNGKLSFSSKCSTARSVKDKGYVICVYTPDYRDMKDVNRVRKVLNHLGFIRPLSYKTDEMTAKGISGSKYRI